LVSKIYYKRWEINDWHLYFPTLRRSGYYIAHPFAKNEPEKICSVINNPAMHYLIALRSVHRRPVAAGTGAKRASATGGTV